MQHIGPIIGPETVLVGGGGVAAITWLLFAGRNCIHQFAWQGVKKIVVMCTVFSLKGQCHEILTIIFVA